MLLLGHLPAVSAEWADTRTAGRFVCRANFPLKGSEAILNDLVQLQADMIRQLQIPEPRESIEIYLFSDESVYATYLKKYFPAVAYRRALYVKDGCPGRVFAFRSPQFEIDLRHETTHALLHAALPTMPLWLDEGLAKYYELPRDARAYDNAYLPGLKWKLRFGSIATLAELEKKTAIADMGRDQYRDAWAWVHFLLNGPPAARNELITYLDDLRTAGAGPLAPRLDRRWANPAQQLSLHYRNWKKPAK